MNQGWSAHGHGAVELPLESPSDEALLKEADPALHALLTYLPAALDHHIGARLKYEASLHGISIANAVLTTASIEPVPALYADRVRFPFFTVYRKGETQTAHTLVWQKSISELEFAYVLPALMPDVQTRLAPILRLVPRVIARALTRVVLPEFQEPLESAGIMAARLVSAKYERYERMTTAAGTNGEQFFRAVVGTIEMVERDVPVDGAFPDFDGADVTLDVVSDDENEPDITVTEFATHHGDEP